MQFTANAVANEIHRDGESAVDGNTLQLASDLAPTQAWSYGTNGVIEHALRAGNQRASAVVNRADAHRDRAIRTPASESNANIDGHDVAIADLALARNAVHQFFVD